MTVINTDPRNPISGAALAANSGFFDWQGGVGELTASGTFGGTVVSLSSLAADGTTLVAVPGATLSAAGSANFTAPRGALQVILTGGSGPVVVSVRTAQQG